VLDAVPYSVRVDVLERLDDMTHRCVPDGMGGRLDAGGGQRLHCFGVRRGVAPERIGSCAMAVGVLQPSGATLDGAVHEELHRLDRPPTAATPLEREHLLHVGARHAPGCDP
jgi:hypothetical protein